MTKRCSHTNLAAEKMAGLVIRMIPKHEHQLINVRRQIMGCVPFTHTHIKATLDKKCASLAAEVKCDRIRIWPQLENDVSIPLVDAVSLCIVHTVYCKYYSLLYSLLPC